MLTVTNRSTPVCTDGKRSLQDAIVSFFPWLTKLSLLLDWFHLVKKLATNLSRDTCVVTELQNEDR